MTTHTFQCCICNKQWDEDVVGYFIQPDITYCGDVCRGLMDDRRELIALKKKDKRPLTIFCDIDGCIFEHDGTPDNHKHLKPKVLPGVYEKWKWMIMSDARIILTTGRRECTRDDTVRQLKEAGLVYDQLIMGLGGGFRVLINDFKPGNPSPTALAFTVERNKGLEDIKF